MFLLSGEKMISNALFQIALRKVTIDWARRHLESFKDLRVGDPGSLLCYFIRDSESFS